METVSKQAVLPRLSELETLSRIARQKAFRGYAFCKPELINKTTGNAHHNYAGTRVYCPGDDTRQINWRSSARSQSLHVQQHYREQNNRWYICVDSSASMGAGIIRKWHFTLQIVCAFSYILLHANNTLSLLSFDSKLSHTIPAGNGNRHFKTIYSFLHTFQPRGQGGSSSLRSCHPSIKSPAKILLISDFLTPDSMQQDTQLLAAKNNELHIIQIQDHQDYSLSEPGLITLTDVESGCSLPVFNDENISRHAQTAAHNHRTQLKQFCARHGFHYAFANSQKHWQRAVLKLLHTL